ncbi:50S ribosomal protein L24 [Candidatus Nomurabacteria bacterium]|nr:50S ribosomal protein L24 [Candidatus Nomurabacteria bacterium]
MKIKKGDKVIVNTGKDRGKEGIVSQVLAKENKVVIDGMNLRKHFMKAGQGHQGGIIEKPAPLQASNVSLLDPKTKKATRVGYNVDSKGVKTRVTKGSGSKLD